MKKKKIYELLFFLLIFLIILSTILLKPLDDLDEIWNYNFARNIANGLIPYRDFNMVITPLLAMVNGLILKITFNELIVMRILAALLCGSIICMIYKIFRILSIKKEVTIIFTFFIGYLFRDIFCIDYNYLSLLINLIIIYMEIKFYKQEDEFIKRDIKKDFFIGVLAGLAILTKQTSGILISLVVLGNKLIFVRKKEQFKVYLKLFLYRLLGVMMPTIIFILYLLINNAFSEFIDYTILGILEFSNKIPYKTLIEMNVVGVLSILVPVAAIYEWIKTICFEKDRKMYFLLVYGIAIFVICFPISNKIHFMIGGTPIIIAIFYEIYSLIKKIVNKISKVKKVSLFLLFMLEGIIIMFLIYYTYTNLYKYCISRESFSELNNFAYISISDSLQEQIKNIDDYIEKEENVKILHASAAIYMIPLDRYNKDYDMFNKGNFGYRGEERLIEQISNSNQIKYLILKDEYRENWQAPTEVINYIKNNKEKIGEVEIFNIYQ